MAVTGEPTDPRPRELIAAARVADGLVFVVGLAGVVAGAQLYRQGNLPFAIIAWILTFIAGAALRLVVWMARGIAAVMDRTQRIEEDLIHLSRNQTQQPPNEDPYGRLAAGTEARQDRPEPPRRARGRPAGRRRPGRPG